MSGFISGRKQKSLKNSTDMIEEDLCEANSDHKSKGNNLQVRGIHFQGRSF